MIIGTPHAKNGGYFRNDDRASGGALSECDIRTCTHCQAIIKMSEWQRDGGWCAKCDAPLCNNQKCVAETNRLGCVPFIKKLDKYYDTVVKFDTFAKLAGLDSRVPPNLIIP